MVSLKISPSELHFPQILITPFLGHIEINVLFLKRRVWFSSSNTLCSFSLQHINSKNNYHLCNIRSLQCFYGVISRAPPKLWLHNKQNIKITCLTTARNANHHHHHLTSPKQRSTSLHNSFPVSVKDNQHYPGLFPHLRGWDRRGGGWVVPPAISNCKGARKGTCLVDVLLDGCKTQASLAVQ